MRAKLRAVIPLSLVLAMLVASPASAQLALEWMVPAAASTPGVNGTDWHTDLSLHNPHPFDLPVEVLLLPSNTANPVADTLLITLGPWQTVNLWDVLGPVHFAADGTGALIVIADRTLPCQPAEDCEFLVTSRTYTLNPTGDGGEFGQTVPGAPVWQGVDWATLGYAAGLLNDGASFRANVGVASWSPDWTSVVVDVQDAAGTILESLIYEVPPYGHLQRRLATPVEGGSLVFWLQDGPEDPLVFGYVSVVDQQTGDASFQLAQPSTVGFASAKASAGPRPRRALPEARLVGPASPPSAGGDHR